MKPAVLSFLLACSAAMAAQSASNAPRGLEATTATAESLNNQPLQVKILPLSRCPVAMHARQGSGGQMLRANDGTSQPVMTPTLNLLPVDKRHVVAATVTAKGFDGSSATLTPASPDVIVPKGTKARKELSRKLTITLAPDEFGTPSAELRLPGFTTVNSIELNSVTYEDGSTWKLAADLGCTVQPDPLLLIGSR